MVNITEKLEGLSLNVENYRPQKRKGGPISNNPSKRTRFLGFTITSRRYNPNTKLYTYTGHFTPDMFNSFLDEFKNANQKRRETSGEVFILRGDIHRHYEGTRNMVATVPGVQASYHVHPSPKNIMNIDDIFSLPSRDDIYYYLYNFPDIQINFIFDTNGVFIIDITGSLVDENGFLRERSDVVLDKYMSYINKLKNTKNSEGYPYYTGLDIKNILENIERVTGGIKIQYIRYNEKISDVTVDINTVHAL